MLKKILELWRSDRNKKGTTLHRRLLLFFVLISVCFILVFALILSLLGITGDNGKAVENHIDTELAIITDKINTDLGRLTLGGIDIAEALTVRSERFFEKNNISADELKDTTELLEPLLSEYMQTLVNTVNNRYCGAAFVMLDATVSPYAENADTSKAGVFIKKTQPTATDSLGVQLHYLRGPASIARENGIMLLGQWRMEFDIEGQDFFTEVMDTARRNPSLPLSRLYYWSGRVTLKDDSEAGLLLCVPLRASDGTVFGLCGIQISARLFKSSYTPEGGEFENIFTVMAPLCDTGLCTAQGLIAGNYYLTGTHWSYDLVQTDTHDGFVHYSGGENAYAGKVAALKLYPEGSPFSEEAWNAAVLMPKDILHSAVQGNTAYFTYTVIILLILAIAVSAFFSRHYLKPVNKALESIKNTPHDEREATPYLEIQDLFDFLATKDKEHGEEVRRLHHEKSVAELHSDRTETALAHLTAERLPKVNQEDFEMFLQCLHTLTTKEREIFDLYLDGKKAKEIMEIANINQNTLKYHNRNIYSKLGVSSRKQLMEYAVLMKYKKN